jgi:hypothetical protein
VTIARAGAHDSPEAWWFHALRRTVIPHPKMSMFPHDALAEIIFDSPFAFVYAHRASAMIPP